MGACVCMCVCARVCVRVCVCVLSTWSAPQDNESTIQWWTSDICVQLRGPCGHVPLDYLCPLYVRTGPRV
jgi:hypothetical protein